MAIKAFFRGPPSIVLMIAVMVLCLTAAEALRLDPGINEPASSGGVAVGTGSRMPDCAHACGPCYPCRRVTVSFKCSLAESCPMVYRCLCGGKYYHVPSS